MPRRAFTAILTAAALLFHVSALANGTPDDAFSLELKKIAADLEQHGQSLYINSSYSDSAFKVHQLFSEVADELIEYDDQLRALNHSPEERMPMLRKRFRTLTKQIDQLGRDVSFDEKKGYTEVKLSDGGVGYKMVRLYPLFDMEAELERESRMRINMILGFLGAAALGFLALLLLMMRKERGRPSDAS